MTSDDPSWQRPANARQEVADNVTRNVSSYTLHANVHANAKEAWHFGLPTTIRDIRAEIDHSQKEGTQ